LPSRGAHCWIVSRGIARKIDDRRLRIVDGDLASGYFCLTILIICVAIKTPPGMEARPITPESMPFKTGSVPPTPSPVAWLARVLMNAMPVAGGCVWTVIPVQRRQACM